MTTVSTPPQRSLLVHAADEFVLTTVVLFLAVTIVRWLRDPGSVLCIPDLNIALAVIGALSGAILTALILTPLGKRSGGHMNPAVTVALWLLDVFPGRRVLPYVLAQLAGSAAGTGLARLAWGRAVALPSVAHAAIRPSATWQPTPVFLAEAGSMAVLILFVGFFIAHPRHARLVPYVIGGSVALVIALLGPLSGGSINPARQFGPAAFSGQTTDLWIYLVAPILGAALGAAIHHLTHRRPRTSPSPKRTTGVAPAGRHHLARRGAPQQVDAPAWTLAAPSDRSTWPTPHEAPAPNSRQAFQPRPDAARTQISHRSSPQPDTSQCPGRTVEHSGRGTGAHRA